MALTIFSMKVCVLVSRVQNFVRQKKKWTQWNLD